MANLPTGFDPNSVDPDARPDPFPAGKYRFMILGTDVKRTKAGDGSYLVIEHEVQGGAHQGRHFFNQITLENPNVQAVEIGQRQLSAVCHAVGYLQALTNSDVLHGRSGEAEIEVDGGSTGKDGKAYGPKNVVKRYVLPGDGKRPTGGASASARPARELETVGASANAGKSKRAWE